MILTIFRIFHEIHNQVWKPARPPMRPTWSTKVTISNAKWKP